jgi:dTDP-4-amino-4,6-dideoxy-D-galactose acyltransferase
MIERLNWDSDFFDYPVGRINVGENFDFQKFISEAQGFSLVYIMSQTALAENSLLKLVDRKLVFCKQLVDNHFDSEIIEFDSVKHKFDELLNLAFLSGKFSRFRLDQEFKANEFERLYRQWIESALLDSETTVLVHVEDETITGFVSVETKPNKAARIGLIAVSEDFQGRRIGLKLVQAACSMANQKGNTVLEVVTQAENQAAVSLYQKSGFSLISSTFIYHYRNQ